MKKVSILLIALFGLFNLNAQTGDLDERYLELLLQSEKRTLINDGMALTTEQAPIFWEIYDAYEAEFSAISKKRMEMLKEYSEAFPTVSDDLANRLINDMYKVNSKVYALRNKYAKKMSKSISPQVAARWVQLDDLINTVVKLSVTAEIPLIGDE
jgi:phosphate uptake regulator